ncbi:MAG: DAK2 domain-containing protein, partial [Mycobacteriales bacterium]
MRQERDGSPGGLIVLPVLDAGALRRWCLAGLDHLTAARAEIDDLNVYPVPDGDTGTNLQLTMSSVVEALDALALTGQRDMAATVAALVEGSLMGA